jgi:hypothetical protein
MGHLPLLGGSSAFGIKWTEMKQNSISSGEIYIGMRKRDFSFYRPCLTALEMASYEGFAKLEKGRPLRWR